MNATMKKKQVCVLCGSASGKPICAACSARVQGEALPKKKKRSPDPNGFYAAR
jgi:hypothetical protein